MNTYVQLKVATFLSLTILVLALGMIPATRTFANQSPVTYGGNYNYVNCNPCNSSAASFAPDDLVAWNNSAGPIDQGTCADCYSSQFQLWGSPSCACFYYQVVMFQVTYGYSGCNYSWCDYLCIAYVPISTACTTHTLVATTRLAATSLEMYSTLNTAGQVANFYIVISGTYYGPYAATYNYYAYASEINLVGVPNLYSGSGGDSTFTQGGSGQFTMYNAGYHATIFQYCNCIAASITGEDSNMSYDTAMTGNGITTLYQGFSYF